VAATAGILLGAVPLADALPGPRWLAAPVAVTASAQAGVSPLLVASGLPVPVVALVANPIAGPAAGWTMGWGVTVGWVAGFLPPGPAGILHLPTRATTAVVLGTARWAAEAPVGSLGPGHLAVAGVGGALVAATWFRWRRDRPPGAVPPMPRWARLGRLVGSAAVVGALVAAAVPGGPAPGERALATGAQVVADDGAVAVVLDGRADALAVLDALRAEGVRRIDHLVVRSPGPRVAATARVVASRLASGEVVVPTGAVTPGRAVRRPERLVVGARVLELTPTASGLDVGVGSLR
jgi:hypothetical protein